MTEYYKDLRKKEVVKDDHYQTGKRVDLFCPFCGTQIMSRFARNCGNCGKDLFEKQSATLCR